MIDKEKAALNPKKQWAKFICVLVPLPPFPVLGKELVGIISRSIYL